ncbi:MAG: cytochrome c [Bacteroidota bacterium]
MKKIYVSSLIVMMAVCLSYCHTAKETASPAPTPVAISFEKSIQPIVMNSCSPCHVPSKGGNKLALDSYGNAKKEIDGILHRIQLSPQEKGYMPAKHERLSDSDIAAFKQWKDSGLAEK